jgi:hypothetical protein
MGMFDGLNTAAGTRGANYFAPGQYKVEIEKFSAFKSSTGGHLVVAIEGRIVEVVASQAGDQDYPASNKVGEVCSQVIKFDGQWRETKLGNLKNFLAAVLAHDESDAGFPWEATAEELSGGDGSALRGATAIALVTRKTTRKGNKISPVVWKADPAVAAAE